MGAVTTPTGVSGVLSLGKEAAPAACPPADSPKVVGVDLSLNATGIATAAGTEQVGCGDLKGTPRMAWICSAVMGHAAGAGLVVVEGPAYSRGGQAGHHESAGLWWLVVYTLDGCEVPYAVVPPTVLKRYATGRGNATKPDMRMALYQRTGLDLRDDNQVDAWWLRAMGQHHLGHPLVNLPDAQRRALDRVDWPHSPLSDAVRADEREVPGD